MEDVEFVNMEAASIDERIQVQGREYKKGMLSKLELFLPP